MNKIRLHLLSIPHTITNNEYSHCAFTGKVLRFSPMMKSIGYEVYHYGTETTESNADVDINIFTLKEFYDFRFKSFQFIYPNLSSILFKLVISDFGFPSSIFLISTNIL